jgi:GNAT superfamily N-acetyltransferase
VITEHAYPWPDLPRELEIQALAFMRISWGTDDPFRDHIHEGPGSVHFVRSVGNLLISHVRVFIIEAGNLRLGGVSGVLTYPQFRGHGHASALLRRAAAHIEEKHLDLGMLFCDAEMEPFYGGLGWRVLEPGRVVVKDDGGEPEDLVMILGDPDVLPEVLELGWSW